jgi:1,4-alpha-glucan branching enzyme
MGLFALVCHTHLPYLRKHGVWPVGEDLFHQAAVESYLPMLDVLERLHDDGIRDAFTIGMSPMIATQLADPYLLDELEWYLGRIEARSWRTVANHGRSDDPDDPPPLHPDAIRSLAAWYATWGRARAHQLDTLRARHGDLARAFASHRDVVELLGGPATHPLLPRIADPALQALQLEAGLAEGARITGSRSRGVWLPECHFAPDRGLEDLLSTSGVDHLVLDGPTVLGALGRGATFQPWRIKGCDTIAFGRDLDTTYRVWSPTGGYPTGRWYRDFYGYDLEGGFKNWRVTGLRVPLHEKQPYEPEAARSAAITDAEDFVAHLVRRIEDHERETGRVALVVAAYDTELFGHWWFEGPIFLEHVIRLLQHTPSVRAVSLEKARELLPEPEAVAFEEGSWGFRKDLRSWVTAETAPMLDALERAERDTLHAVRADLPRVTGARRDALAQAVRELLLLQSSDWPFMIVRGRNPDYAWQRFEAHRRSLERCIELARSRIPDDLIARDVAAIRDTDGILPGIDPGALLR